MKDRKLLDELSASALERTSLDCLSLTSITKPISQYEGLPAQRCVKKFALTLHFYSPRAYDYVKTLFVLPHSSSL